MAGWTEAAFSFQGRPSPAAPLRPTHGDRLLRLILTAAAAFLTGCAVYRPAPLAGAEDAVLTPPSRAALAAAALRLNHPRLRPVTIDFSRPLTPEALGVIAVLANPDLKAARAKARVTEAQAFSAGLLPDPQLSGGIDKLISGPDPYDGWAAQIAFDLIALRDRGVVRVGQRAAREQARLDLAWQEWQVAGQARLLAARIAGLQRVTALDVQSRRRADSTLAVVLGAAARGDVAADQVEARRIAAADAADRARTAERDLAAARLDLNKQLGLPPAARVPIAPAPPGSRTLDPAALFATARAERLDLLALQAGYASQEAAVRKSVMDQFPALQLTLATARDTAGNLTVGPQVAFTLPLWNRNRGGVAVAQATRAQLRAEYAARLFSTRADIAALVGGLELERRQRAEIAAQTGPLERLVLATEAAARRGDLAVVTAETARQSLVDKQLVLAALDQAMAEQTVALDIAVGAPLGEP